LSQHLLHHIIENAMDATSEALNVAVVDGLRAMHESIRASGTNAGSTVTVCAVNLVRLQLSVWNVGDSLAVLIGGDHSIKELGMSHRLVDNADELRRVVALGAKVARQKDVNGRGFGPLRVWPGGMTMTRSLGNADAGEFMSAEPNATLALGLPTGGAVLVVGSDGVWENLDRMRVARLIMAGEHDSVTGAAKTVVERAARMRFRDDTTAVVLAFGPLLGRLFQAPLPDRDCQSEPRAEPVSCTDHGLAPATRQHGAGPHCPPDQILEDGWSAHDAACLLSDVRAGIGREAVAKRLLRASSRRQTSSHAARVLRSWRLLVCHRLSIPAAHYYSYEPSTPLRALLGLTLAG